jgi:hypothetical protein
MSYVSKTLTDAAIGVGVADTPAGLSTLHKPGCAAVLWRRQMPSDVQAWLEQLDPATLPNGRIILRPAKLAQAFEAMCHEAGTPPGSERDWLRDDVTELGEMFATLMGSEHVRLRLGVVTNNACRRFHIDALHARLICTYRGSGTQYGISTDGEAPSRVFQVATGAPFVLRGTLWPEDPPSGLLHRSPPIEGTGEARLVLVLDPIFDPEGAE